MRMRPWFLMGTTEWVGVPLTAVGNAGRAGWREMISSVWDIESLKGFWDILLERARRQLDR